MSWIGSKRIMYTDTQAIQNEARWHHEELMARSAEDDLARRIRARQPASRAGLPARLDESVPSLWILLVCAWGSIRAGGAPSRC